MLFHFLWTHAISIDYPLSSRCSDSQQSNHYTLIIAVLLSHRANTIPSSLMAPIRCCGFGGSPSPEPEPLRLVSSSQGRGRFALSSTASSAESSDVRPIQEIFASISKNEGGDEAHTASGHDHPSRHELQIPIQRKESSRRLHEVASKVRKRISRDSSISRRSSKHRLSASKSNEDIDRPNELKRALHQRVQSDLIEDLTVSDNSYDEDAVPIKTPQTTWGRHEGSVKISPKDLGKVLAKSGSHSSYTERSQRDPWQTYGPKNTAVALSRMLTQRASHLTDESEYNSANTALDDPKRQDSKKYIFEEEDTPKGIAGTRLPSPVTRSNTVVRMPPSGKPLEKGFTNPSFLDAVEAPTPPNLLPTHLNNIPEPEASGDLGLSFSERYKATLPVSPDRAHTTAVGNAKQPVIYDTKIRPASEQWLHGASRFLSPKVHSKQTSHQRYQGDEYSHHCDPEDEEMIFGGIDGEDESPPESAYYTAKTRASSDGDEAGHHYNMHVPKRFVSKSLLPAAALPQLQGPRRDRSYTSEESSTLFSVVPQRKVSSDAVTSKIPMAWENHSPRAASSVYSSQPESLLSSRRGSLVQFNSLSDRVQQYKDYKSHDGIISVPATRLRPVDVEKLEYQTSDPSFHSSNESFTRRELAAAERRISSMSRANTLPKSSRFREELDQVSAELALTNPPRRRFSNLDGSSDLRSRSISSPGSLHSLSLNDEATSVWEKAVREHARLSLAPSKSLSRLSVTNESTSAWEKALREHALEDAALKHTRLGSYSPDLLGDTQIGPMNEAMSRKPSTRPYLYRNQAHLFVEGDHGPQLQARLAAYKLPTYHPTSKRKRPVVDELKRSSSAYPIGSWSRYPSHSRPERSSSPAGVEDQVFARDFADMTPSSSQHRSPNRQDSKLGPHKRKRSMNFGKHMLSQLSRLYKYQSQDLQKRLVNEARGNRSSISEGGMLKYPELELLGRLSPPLPSPAIATKVAMEERVKSKSKRETQGGEDAKEWSKLYEDCVVPPPPSEMGNSPVRSAVGSGVTSPMVSPMRSSEELVGPRDVYARGGEGDGNGTVESRRPKSESSELRASTLDFKKSLEVSEGLAREKMLGFMERMSG